MHIISSYPATHRPSCRVVDRLR